MINGNEGSSGIDGVAVVGLIRSKWCVQPGDIQLLISSTLRERKKKQQLVMH